MMPAVQSTDVDLGQLSKVTGLQCQGFALACVPLAPQP